MTTQTTAKMSEWDEFSHYFERLEIPVKTVLLQEGQISKHAYFIEKGCLRSWFNNNGLAHW